MEEQGYIYGRFKEGSKSENSSEVLYSTWSIEHNYQFEETTKDGFKTLLEGWNQSASSFPENNWLGHLEGEKYVWRTYKQAHHEAQSLAKALFSKKLVTEVNWESEHKQILNLKLMGLYSK